jgi:hypothetical protein
MNHYDTSIFDSAHRVGLAVGRFPKELADFAPCKPPKPTVPSW